MQDEGASLPGPRAVSPPPSAWLPEGNFPSAGGWSPPSGDFPSGRTVRAHRGGVRGALWGGGKGDKEGRRPGPGDSGMSPGACLGHVCRTDVTASS